MSPSRANAWTIMNRLLSDDSRNAFIGPRNTREEKIKLTGLETDERTGR